MKIKEFKDLKNKNEKELLGLLKSRKLEVVDFSTKIYAGREKNLKKVLLLRKDIARILTIISLKKKGGEK